MVAVVFIGAGASFGSGETTPYQAPLGFQLFDRLVEQEGIARTFPPDLAATFRSNFEAGVAAYRATENSNMAALQREIALYLAKLTPGPNNHYVELIRGAGWKNVVYVTLNYDLMIELAARHLSIDTHYDFANPNPGIRLLKIHGSCNWWPVGPKMEGVTFEEGMAAHVDLPVKSHNQNDTIGLCLKQDSYSPSMAYFAEGKPVTSSPSAIKAQQIMWLDTIAKATRIFVVGVRVYPIDTHIWEPLANTKARMTYFGREESRGEFDEWVSKTPQKGGRHFVVMPFDQSCKLIPQLMS